MNMFIDRSDPAYLFEIKNPEIRIFRKENYYKTHLKKEIQI
jgi:hypothetical protein